MYLMLRSVETKLRAYGSGKRVAPHDVSQAKYAFNYLAIEWLYSLQRWTPVMTGCCISISVYFEVYIYALIDSVVTV